MDHLILLMLDIYYSGETISKTRNSKKRSTTLSASPSTQAPSSITTPAVTDKTKLEDISTTNNSFNSVTISSNSTYGASMSRTMAISTTSTTTMVTNNSAISINTKNATDTSTASAVTNTVTTARATILNTASAATTASTTTTTTTTTTTATTTSTTTTTTTTTNTTSSATTTKQKASNKKTRLQSIETPPPSTSRTPDTTPSLFNQQSSFGGLKFGYEAQSNATPTGTPPQPLSVTPIKDSPPSSPGSEAGSRKRNRPSTDTKDFKIFQNGVHHMLGNQLNPSSSVAQKMSDQLHMEIEANSLYTSSSLDSGTQLIGPPFPGKHQAQVTFFYIYIIVLVLGSYCVTRLLVASSSK